MKTLQFAVLITLAAAALYAQPTGGPVYWSTDPNLDCSSLPDGFTQNVPIKSSSGTTIGYSCEVSGTFIWLAAGGEWGSVIRMATPAAGPVGVVYSFYDNNGNPLKLDLRWDNMAPTGSGATASSALAADQPSELELLGKPGEGPNYTTTETGTVYAQYFCPNSWTCSNVLPQLIYSALPSVPWSLSVPIAWDTALNTAWSAVGVDDGGARRVSLVVYNEDIAPTSYRVRVFDGSGKLAVSGMTPSIPPLQSLANGAYGEGGTYAAMLADVAGPLPAGPFKILIDGGPMYSAVEVLQFDGASATALLAGYDSRPGPAAGDAPRPANLRQSRVASRPKTVFPPLPAPSGSK